MQIVRSGSSWKTPWNPRSQFARWDRTTPLGRPVLPLVKKMTWGSVSTSRSSRSSSSGSGRQRGSSRRTPSSIGLSALTSKTDASTANLAIPADAATDANSPERPSSEINTRARASCATSDASLSPSRAFNGAYTAPSLARATKSGRTSRAVSAQTTTRSPWPIPRSFRRAVAIRLASRSRSA